MNTVPKAYFISGVSGVGKSSVISHLKELLPTNAFDIRDFDERGVPDGGGPVWHDAETLHWFDVAKQNANDGKSTIITGFANPEKLFQICTDTHPLVELILLHASGETIRKRLLGRYPNLESVMEIERAAGTTLPKFVENCVSYAPKLRELCEKAGCSIIDTNHKTPKEIAEKNAELL